MKTKFERELADLINKHSLENESNTPDFILATFLKGSLDNFNSTIDSREQWYGRGDEVVDDSIELPVDFMGDNTPNEIDLNPPPKQVFKIEVGDMDEADIDEYIKEITKQFKDCSHPIDFKGWNPIEPIDVAKDRLVTKIMEVSELIQEAAIRGRDREEQMKRDAFINKIHKLVLAEKVRIKYDEDCDHDYSDGTGTGYYVCKKCGDQF